MDIVAYLDERFGGDPLVPRDDPALLEWFGRIYRRPAFQQGVMGKHRAWNLAFRDKSRIENLLGVGLRHAARGPDAQGARSSQQR